MRPPDWRKIKYTSLDDQKNITLTEAGWIALEVMAKDGCTRREIAATLGVHYDTLYELEKRNPEIREIIENGHEIGRRELRAWQRRAAKKGQTGMLVWLGKNWLGQTDKAEVKNTTQLSLENLDMSRLTNAQAAQLQLLLRVASGVEPESSVAPPGVLPVDKRAKGDAHHKLLRTTDLTNVENINKNNKE